MQQRIRRILVAIKDPQIAECVAARKAAQLARGLSAELCLFHAVTRPLYLDTSSLGEQPVARAREAALSEVIGQLDKLAAPLRTGGLEVRSLASWDYPSHEAVVRAALQLGADLVAVDCARGKHTAAWFFHFTDWELLRSCPLPLLLVKEAASYTRAPVLAAIDPELVTGKPPSLEHDILSYGSILAGALDDHLHAVYAYNPLPALSVEQLLIPQLLAEAEQQAYTEAHALLTPILDSVKIEQRCRHVEEGFAIDVIESVLRRTSAQILVLGSTSRRGIKALTIGNTAERMLDRVRCDMLIVKPAEYASAIHREARGVQIVPMPSSHATVRAAF